MQLSAKPLRQALLSRVPARTFAPAPTGEVSLRILSNLCFTLAALGSSWARIHRARRDASGQVGACADESRMFRPCGLADVEGGVELTCPACWVIGILSTDRACPPCRLRVDVVLNQPVHTLVKPVEGQFLRICLCRRIESALRLHAHCPLPPATMPTVAS